MPAVQTTYTETMRAGLPGQIASEWGQGGNVETRLAEGTAGIGFGLAVSLGTGVKGAALGGVLNDFLGVSVRDITLVAQAGQTVDLYQNGDNMAVLNEGDIWVTAAGAVTAGETVQYESDTGVFAAASGTNTVKVPGARWLTTVAATDGGIAAMRLTRPYHNT